MGKLLLLFSALLLLSCKKTTDPPEPETAQQSSVTLKVRHLWDNSTDFQLDTMLVNPLNGDSLKFTNFRYYLSNVKLKRDNGTWWEMANSYFIVNAGTPEGCMLDLGNVPNGTYTAVEYTLGVDSLHNVSGTQTGALDPLNGMYWSWTSGYIMIMAEGTSPDIGQGNLFSFHMTGFLRPLSIVVTHTENFPSNLELTNSSKTIRFTCNPSHLWQHGPIATYNSISGASSTTQIVAAGFQSSFSFDGFE